MDYFVYRTIKFIIKPFFIIIHGPKYIGLNNIPEDGCVILAGNHTNPLDAFLMTTGPKRIVHMMAKKELFNSKLKKAFFKSVACISVDRSIHDENAKNQAIEILNQGGCVGLFPEGTRNEVTCKEDKLNTLYEIVKDKYTKEELIRVFRPKCLKYTQIELLIELNKKKVISNEELKEYVLDPDNSLKKLLKAKKIKMSDYDNSLLIPLKFGAVSFAVKTGAKIVPFGISGDYSGKKGNLTCNIGKPISVEGLSLEEANTILSKSIIKLMKNNK